MIKNQKYIYLIKINSRLEEEIAKQNKIKTYNSEQNYFKEFDGERNDENEPFRDIIKQ